MRMMMRAKIPVEAGNAGISEGTMTGALQQVMELMQPEAVYIGPEDGERRVLIFFDLKDVSDIPAITEPFFQKMNASVELMPVMNLEDMQAGVAKLA